MNEYAEKILAGEMYRETMVVVLVAFSAIIAIISSMNGNPWGASFAGGMVYLLLCALTGTVIRVVAE